LQQVLQTIPDIHKHIPHYCDATYFKICDSALLYAQ